MISQKVFFFASKNRQSGIGLQCSKYKKTYACVKFIVKRIFWRAFETVYGINYNPAPGLHICRSLYLLFIVMPEAPRILYHHIVWKQWSANSVLWLFLCKFSLRPWRSVLKLDSDSKPKQVPAYPQCWNFRTIYEGQETSRNRVNVPARQAT